MSALPYRGESPERNEAEEREIAAFAREMRAGRRTWTHRGLAQAIGFGPLGVVHLALLLLLSSRATWPSTVIASALPLLFVAVAIAGLVEWRRDARHAREKAR